ncbi:MAG: hypothetical protein MUO68_04655 [Desulfobacteraceae bacterium]|nr:hypothetical protein [Desulfobacteraceae bacterium]
MILKRTSLSSPIEKKIAWAHHCYREFGNDLLKEKRLVDLLVDLKAAIVASRREMALTGIVEVCRRCEQEEGGSCCGAGLENRYGGWLLLINLLLGVKLPETRQQTDSCFLLGKNGCLLMARHVICINYLCKKITNLFEPRTILEMREKESEEVNTLFMLHESIKPVLRKWTNT